VTSCSSRTAWRWSRARRMCSTTVWTSENFTSRLGSNGWNK